MKVIENTSPPRGNGVTILMNNQVFVTQPPTQLDNLFVQQAVFWIREYQKGKPRA